MEKLYTLIDKFLISLPATTEFEKGFYLALLLAALVFVFCSIFTDLAASFAQLAVDLPGLFTVYLLNYLKV